MMLVAQLVFMTTESFLSRLIRFDEKGAVSHVCAILDDGTAISSDLGAGVRHESLVTALAGATMQITVDIPMSPDMYFIWKDYLLRRVGEPFDTEGVFGMAIPLDLHKKGALFCAALQLGALRKCHRFPRALSQRFHMVSPVVLLLMLQSQPAASLQIHDPVVLAPEKLI
jgi:hypothetical protein